MSCEWPPRQTGWRLRAAPTRRRRDWKSQSAAEWRPPARWLVSHLSIGVPRLGSNWTRVENSESTWRDKGAASRCPAYLATTLRPAAARPLVRPADRPESSESGEPSRARSAGAAPTTRLTTRGMAEVDSNGESGSGEASNMKIAIFEIRVKTWRF